MNAPSARPIDHLVLPTASLATARARLSALGFTVAPDGIHPFGTANCCVYLADGTFLEPLAVADTVVAAAAAGQGNVFVARDASFRSRNGNEGFSAVVFATDDADSDHTAFVEAGVSAGDMLEFSRDFVDATGRKDRATFRLAFAADNRVPDMFFFTCARIGVPNVDRSALQRHANGVSRLKRVVISDATGAVEIARQAAFATPPDERGTVTTPNAAIEMWGGERLTGTFATLAPDDARLMAVVFGVADLATTSAALAATGVAFEHRDDRIVVQPAPGQGATFAFEAA